MSAGQLFAVAIVILIISFIFSIPNSSNIGKTKLTTNIVTAPDLSNSLVVYTFGDLKKKFFPEFHAKHRNFTFPFLQTTTTINVSILQQYKFNSSGVGSAVWDGSAVLSTFLARRGDVVFGADANPGKPHVVVEIGAGQGLVSITSAMILTKLHHVGARVYATDGDASCLVQAQTNVDRHLNLTLNTTSTNSKEQQPTPVVTITTNLVRWGHEEDARSVIASAPATWVLAADVVFENKAAEKKEEEEDVVLHGANQAFEALTKTFDQLMKRKQNNALLLAYKRRRDREERFFDMMKEKGFQSRRIKKRFVHRRYRDTFELICFDKDGTCVQRLGRLVEAVNE